MCSTVPITLPRIVPTARPIFFALRVETDDVLDAAAAFFFFVAGGFDLVVPLDVRVVFRSMIWALGSISRRLVRRCGEGFFLRP